MLTARDAEEMLAGEDLVELFTGALAYAKEVRETCLAADVPAALGPCSGKT